MNSTGFLVAKFISWLVFLDCAKGDVRHWKWWLDMIDKTLDEGSTFERIGSRQLAGLVIAVW